MTTLSTSAVYEAADRLRGIATMGLHYAGNEYDKARYQVVLDVALDLVSKAENRPVEALKQEFLLDNWMHVSPMQGAEAVVVRGNAMLLMKRTDDQKWCLPGGLVEIGETLAEAAVRELKEEVGLTGQAVRLLGIFDSRKWNSRVRSQMYHSVFLVESSEGVPATSNEALAVGYFAEDSLPELSPGHDVRVPFLFRLLREETTIPYFDQ